MFHFLIYYILKKMWNETRGQSGWRQFLLEVTPICLSAPMPVMGCRCPLSLHANPIYDTRHNQSMKSSGNRTGHFQGLRKMPWNKRAPQVPTFWPFGRNLFIARRQRKVPSGKRSALESLAKQQDRQYHPSTTTPITTRKEKKTKKTRVARESRQYGGRSPT